MQRRSVLKNTKKENNVQLNCVGIRKAEGGARSVAYKSCFSEKQGESDEFRPIFWYSDGDKVYYDNHFSVVHGKCYTEYGMKRTGCAGCPYGRDFETELEIIKEHEPKLYKACLSIFGQSYEYTRKYREFAKMMKEKSKGEE